MIKKTKSVDAEGNEIEIWEADIYMPKVKLMSETFEKSWIENLKKMIEDKENKSGDIEEYRKKMMTRNPDIDLGDKPSISMKNFGVVEKMHDLDNETLKDITEIRPENKDWVLKALGFKRINTFTWEHPWFINNNGKYIEFDINTDDLPKLVTKIFNKGMDLMSEKIIKVIK